jgi:hypothetical protein
LPWTSIATLALNALDKIATGFGTSRDIKNAMKSDGKGGETKSK